MAHRPKREAWYHSRIIDWMIANPGVPLKECAKWINRTPTTLSMIINSDMFKAAYAARKAEFQLQHDMGIIQKTTKVAHASLDAILDTLEKKRDKVPLDTLRELNNDALEVLGYGTKTASAVVNITNSNQTVVVPVSASDLEEARLALRTVQAAQARALPVAAPNIDDLLAPASEVGPVIDGEAESAPADIPS